MYRPVLSICCAAVIACGIGAAKAYDNNQNLTNESLVVDGLTLAGTYNYNAIDELASIAYPVLRRPVTFSPDVLGRPTRIVTPTGSMFGAGFWPNGQIADIAFAGGSRVTYGQNAREWLNAVTVKTGDGVTRIASTLTHDVTGNLIGVADSVDASYNRTMSFDGINRVNTTNGPWGSGLVQYDGAGNIKSIAAGPTSKTLAYDGQNRLSSVTFSNSTVVRYGHDAYGNAAPQFQGYVYDTANNLSSVADFEFFAYDGANSRVKATKGSTTTYEFRSAHGLLLAEWRKQSGYYDVLKEHLHLAGKEVAEQQTQFIGADIKPVSWMFIQNDANGSPIAATWGGGGLLFKESYEPYGSTINGTAQGYTQRAFAGKKQDSADLIYMGARYYNPLVGRFLSIDPKEADPSDVHGLNRYAYANNNPYRYVDPDGRSVFDLAFLAVDAVKLGIAIYKGEGVAEAAIDVGLSAVGVISPTVGLGQALKGLKVAEKVVVEAKAADKAVEAGKAATNAREAEKAADVANVSRRPSAATRREADAAATDASGQLRCQYCKQKLTKESGAPNSREFDHYNPFSKGGTSDSSNINAACRTCNRSKSDKSPSEWSGTSSGAGTPSD